MINAYKNHTKTSKLLAKVLRHEPDLINLTLDKAGWTDVQTLIHLLKKHGHAISLEELFTIVETNDKKRFTLSADNRKIRAAQGHSIDVDLMLTAKRPPEQLFHGTAAQNLDSIFSAGLIPGRRQHVHLSKDEETALKVGSRHGKAVLLRIDTQRAFENGIEFFEADNGVWLATKIPSAYIRF